MRILQVNKFYRMVGGSERYLFNVSELLQQQGHEVIPFAMAHPDNAPSPWSRFFVDRIEYYSGSLRQRLVHRAKAIPRMIWSRQAARRMAALLREARPDVAQLHMIDHQLSPSILPVLSEAGVPVVLTAHQYKLVCPNYRLLNERTHEVCELCLDGRYHHPCVVRCHRGSLLSSSLLALELWLHKRWQVYEKHVDVFHTPSRFMAGKLIEGGLPRERVQHADLTLDLDAYACQREPGTGLVYFGRLSPEKGVGTLLRAVAQVPEVTLTVVGGGPHAPVLQDEARVLGLQERVTFTGPLYGAELTAAIGAAAAVVLPSEWYENSPLVIYESFALGRPVLGAEIGGIAEYIQPGVTGELFPPGDATALASAIRSVQAHPERLPQLQQQARAFAEERFAPSVHYAALMEIYRNAIENRGVRG